jgi:hypothetical protein
MPRRISTPVFEKLSTLSPGAIYSINIVLLILLGWLDYITGDYSLIIFYLVPVALAAWFVNRWSGVLFCVLAFVTRLIADAAITSFSFTYTPLHSWNLSVEFLFLLIMSLLVSTLRKHVK